MKTTTKQSFLKKPIFWGGLAVFAAVAWVMTDNPSATGSGIKALKRKAPSSTSKGTITFTKEDELADFSRVTEPIKTSAFFPAVVKSGIKGGTAANLIPADFADGDGNWVYTGSAEVNGVRSALIENKKSGEGAFLKANQKWKSSLVVSVGLDSVVLTGPSGTRTIGLLKDEEISSFNRAVTRIPQGDDFSPAQINVPSNLRGRIGQLPSVNSNGGLTVVPSGNNPVASNPPAIFAGDEGVVFDGN